ncbi:MAG: dihydroorotase [Burkholderiaceae bacterium]|jgi:dihydroorotase|nr:dihydroorotase [Burkholderiaceae bacterium]
MKLVIRHGRLIDPASSHDAVADLYIADGRIAAVGGAPSGFVAEREIDARGLVVAPGLVDLCARMREPGAEGALKREMRAALAGGVTGVVCPPDTDPPLDEPGLVRMLRQRSREAAGARLYPLGALTAGLKGEVLAEIETLAEAGCVAFMQTTALPHDNGILLQILRYARTFDLPVWLRPVEDTLAADGVAAAGALAGRLGLPAVPALAETVALHTVFEMQRETGARVHLCRLSSAAGIELVRQARREGLPVTADVGVHHVHLTDVDIGYFDPDFRLDPPLRGQRDRDAIVAGLADGTIDAICSDHAPVGEDDKLLPFGEAAPGATALETLLPLVLKWGQAAKLPLASVLARVSSAPARILDEPTGRLAVGAKADVVLFDPQAHWTVTRAELASRGGNTPYSGYELVGRAMLTLVGGDVRFDRKTGSESNFR